MAARGWFCYPQHPGEPHHPGNLQHPARTPRSSESGYTSSQNTYANDRVCYVDVGFPGGGRSAPGRRAAAAVIHQHHCGTRRSESANKLMIGTQSSQAGMLGPVGVVNR